MPRELNAMPRRTARAVFFLTYDTGKEILRRRGLHSTAVHVLSASLGEMVACLIRVPVEVLKQRQQVGHHANVLEALKFAFKTDGVKGLYRGYLSTIFRELPFSALQFPLWEASKVSLARYRGRDQPTAIEAGICGAIAGGFSAGVTTPLDVAKTRIMLAVNSHEAKLAQGRVDVAVALVYREKGIKGLFAGVVPRVIWISVGGAIFLGVYEKVKHVLDGL
ncbi:unnamed protein product [Notodromas monacha]|uniref:S-adenosylmethionine mitochondrial carrier protein n=1 Tax=Notodromas monacha TaxID=399045 RepID=A0A7R9BMP5_9CRUS|nr:unnamed protein product [Notodromas monacha]CAG0917232.1 unnamed protein product [Notodromas monacha]